MNVLGAVCPCGHAAFHHMTVTQQSAYMISTNGRYQGECKGGVVNGGVACRCITDREAVIDAWKNE